MIALDVLQTLRAGDVALGAEVATGKKTKKPDWIRHTSPFLDEAGVMDMLSEERLMEMEAQAAQKVMNGLGR